MRNVLTLALAPLLLTSCYGFQNLTHLAVSAGRLTDNCTELRVGYVDPSDNTTGNPNRVIVFTQTGKVEGFVGSASERRRFEVTCFKDGVVTGRSVKRVQFSSQKKGVTVSSPEGLATPPSRSGYEAVEGAFPPIIE